MIRSDELANLSADQQRELLRKLLLEKAEEESRFAMSVQQQGLWYDYRRDQAATAYNVFLPVRIRSQLDVDRFHRAIDLLVERHACLRTTFSDADGKPVQQIHDELRPDFEIIDSVGLSDDEIRRLASVQAARPFDLENGPMLRLALFRRSDTDSICIATTHHIVVDFWSLVLLLNEMRDAYQCLLTDRESTLPDAPNNYHSFVRQQQEMLEGPRGQLLRRYWQQKLRGSSQVTELPTDFIRPERFTARAEIVSLDLEGDLVDRMSALANNCNATFQALVLAVVQTLIHRYTGQESFQIGSPFAGRLHRRYERTVGFFVNMLPLRADLSGDPTFEQIVHCAASRLVEGLEHEDLPLAEIVVGSGTQRDPSRHPLFQVSCTFEKSHLKQEAGTASFLLPTDAQRSSLGGIEQESFMVPLQTCHYDIEFVFERSDDGLHGMICYCRDLFARDTMEQLADNFRSLSDQLVQHAKRPLSEVPWICDLESTQRVQSPDETVPLIDRSIAELRETSPNGIALASPKFDCTFQDLNEAADAIAGNLNQRGIGVGSFVPVIARRGPEVIAVLLGVIRSGAAVVPIDAQQPAIDGDSLIADTSANLVIVDSIDHWNSELQDSEVTLMTIDDLLVAPSIRPESVLAAGANDLCYLIYTSGSSGRPKGVMVEHASIDNTLCWRNEAVPLGQDDRVLVLLSHQFDAGFGIILTTLVQGAALVWTDHETSDIDAIIDVIIDQSITVLPAIPSLLSLLIDHPRFEECRSLRQLWTGGQSMPPDLPARLRDRRAIPFWNFYGPTEAAVEATAANVQAHDPNRIVPIGRPVKATEVLVLDENHRPLPPTVPGELAICGPGVARGYLGRPGLTSERFPRISDGRRVYLTGDRGRMLADGSLEFLGRTDNQVKLSGYRIELEEIEQVLRSCPVIEDAAVIVAGDQNDSACLGAYITKSKSYSAENGNPLHSAQRFVASRLPSYKRPRQFHVLDSIPKTSSGKVDRARLPKIEFVDAEHRRYVPPRTALEQFLADEWSEMLGLAQVGISADFFELGGTSLQAAMMANRLNNDLGVHVPTALLFDLADVSRLAARLTELHRDEMEQRFGSESILIYKDRPRSRIVHDRMTDHPLITNLNGVNARDEQQKRPTPIFMIHPPGGIVVCYRDLAIRCRDRPIYAVRSRGLHGSEPLPETMEAMVADYVDAIQSVAPSGPYQIGGWSLGGLIAYEVARQLMAGGNSVERLILLDTAIPTGVSDLTPETEQPDAGLEYGLDVTLDQLAGLEAGEQLPLLWEHAKKLGVLDDQTPQEIVDRTIQDLRHLFHHHVQLSRRYRLQPIDVPLLLVRPLDVPFDVGGSDDRGWSAIVENVRVEFVPGHHHSMVQPPNVDAIARLLSE